MSERQPEQQGGGTAHYYLSDAQHSTRLLTDSDGNVSDTYRYSAYGELLDQTGATPNAYLYTGQRHDDLTGLYDLRARQYDPAIGRFLSRDTWSIDTQNPLELNRYVYAAANPVLWADPSGYTAFFETGGRYNQISLNVAALSDFGYFVATQHARILISLVAARGLYAIYPYLDDLAATLADILFRSGSGVGTETQTKARAVLEGVLAPWAVAENDPQFDPDLKPLPWLPPLGNPTQEDPRDEDESPQRHISLGLSYERNTWRPLLEPFTINLNVLLNPHNITVHAYTAMFDINSRRGFPGWFGFVTPIDPNDWGSLIPSIKDAMHNADAIHFNLETLPSDYVGFANNYSYRSVTAQELSIIKSDPQLCGKTYFYERGTQFPPIPSISASTQICGFFPAFPLTTSGS